MKLLIVAWRELAEHKLVWAAAIVTGLLGALYPWLKGSTSLAPQEAPVVAMGLVLGFVWAMAALLGASMFPGDLANHRIGFYLIRPLSMGAILGGRFLGAWLLATGGGALVALGIILGHPQALHSWADLAQALGAGAITAIPILLLFHILGTVWHARSPWILLSLATLGGSGWIMARLVKAVLDLEALEAMPWLLGGAATLGVGVLALAVYLQMARGRADLQRGHRILALTLAAGLMAVALAGTWFTGWLQTEGPTTLTTFQVQILAPKGDWIWVTGTGRMHRQAFLLNTATGETVKQPHGGRFSADGRHFVSMGGANQVTIKDVDLGVTPARTLAIGAFPLKPEDGTRWIEDVSQDGRLVLVVLGRRFLVVDLKTGRQREEALAPTGPVKSRFRFSGILVREYRPLYKGGTEIRELDLDTGQWTVCGGIPQAVWFRVDPSQAQVLVPDGATFLVCDARSGSAMGRLSPQPNGTFQGVPRPCGDGTYAAVEKRPEGAVLRILATTGKEGSSLPLQGPAMGPYLVYPEEGTHRVFVNALESQESMVTLKGRLWVADAQTHTLAAVSTTALLPMGYWNSDRGSQLATRLRVGRNGGLVLAAPDGSSRTVLRTARWAVE